jgi:TRAP-type transport system periplasmic protein
VSRTYATMPVARASSQKVGSDLMRSLPAGAAWGGGGAGPPGGGGAPRAGGGARGGRAAAPARADEPIELSAYGILSLDSVLNQGLVRFAETVEERTDGGVVFDIYHSGELGGDVETIEDMRRGAIDMRLAGAGLHSHFYPEIQMLELPYLFRDPEHLREVVLGPIGRELLDGFEDHGVKALGFLDVGFRNVSNSVRPVHSVEDVQGLRIRVPEIDSYVKTWEAFGASPTAMAWPDVYMALQTGVIDAQDNAPEHTWSNRTYEVQDHYSVINYTWMGGVLTMNLDRWNELPEDVQEIMLEAAREAGEWTFDELSQANVDALDRMEEAGLEVIRDPDLSGFMAAAEKVYEELAAEPWYDAELIERIRSAGM